MSRPEPAAFLSYVHSDDDHDHGRISALRKRLEGEVRMHTGKPFAIFQDRNDLAWGENWSMRIDKSLNEVTFLIPIITPSFLASPACRKEYSTFQQRERSLGYNDLILPLYYLSVDDLHEKVKHDEIIGSLSARQYSDWRELRFSGLDSPEVAKQLAGQAAMKKSRISALNQIIDNAAKKDQSSAMTARGSAAVHRFAKSESHPAGIAPKVTQQSDLKTLSKEVSGRELVNNYAIYTTEFDEEVAASELMDAPSQISLLQTLTTLASNIELKHRRTIGKFIKSLTNFVTIEPLSVIILLDNSGSLKGTPISHVAAWAVVIASAFEQAGARVQVSGFTTRSWRGGQSREKWIKDGCPPNPGRLCDLRYISYKTFDQPIVSTVQNFSVMLRDVILKENVDGEALTWAVAQLGKQHTKRKVVLTISDGAPVDDSTLIANGVRYLSDNLRSVISHLRTSSNPQILSAGVNYDVKQYYDELGVNSNIETLGRDILLLFQQRIFTELHD